MVKRWIIFEKQDEKKYNLLIFFSKYLVENNFLYDKKDQFAAKKVIYIIFFVFFAGFCICTPAPPVTISAPTSPLVAIGEKSIT